MQEFKLIAISLVAAFALALAAWVYAKLMLRSLRNEDEEAQLGKDRLKRLRPRWLSIVSYAVSLLAMSIPLFTPIPTLSLSWIVFTALTVIGIAATVHYTRLLRTEADDSPLRPIAKRHRRFSLVFAALCATATMWLVTEFGPALF